MRMQPATRGAEGGFTLISVIVAIVILSTGLLALARAQAMLVKSQGTTANRSVALTIARDYMEVMRSRDPWTIASEAGATVDARGTADVNGKYTRAVTVTVIQPNLVQVRLTVSYPRGVNPIEIVTLIYRSS
jgi:type IV pilus modification protein PilV